MRITSGHLEDICAIIGFRATMRLIAWRDGSNLYIPKTPDINHILVHVLSPEDSEHGYRMLKKLCEEYGSETIPMSAGLTEFKLLRKLFAVIRLRNKGLSIDEIACKVGISHWQTRRMLWRAVMLGLPVVTIKKRSTPAIDVVNAPEQV